MEKERRETWKENLLLILLGVAFFVAISHLRVVGEAIWSVISLFMPLIVGGVIAFLLNVPMHFFEKKIEKLYTRLKPGHKGAQLLRRMKVPIALIITLVLFVAAVYIIGSVIFPNLVQSIVSVAGDINAAYPQWIAFLEAHDVDTSVVTRYLEKIDFNELIAGIRDNSDAILNMASAAADSIVSVFSNLGFGLIFAIYILMSKKKLGQQAKKIAYAYLKGGWADEVCDIASLSYKTFAGFLSGQCLEAVILGTMFCVVLLIGGFPYAVTIGVIIGAMSLIPFVGAFIGLLFGILLIAVENLNLVIWFIILFFVVQQIEGNLIYPRVVGGSVGLPAIWTLLAVVVGGSVSGIFGIVAFIPLFSVFYALLRRSVYSRLKKKNLMPMTGEE